MSAALLVLAYLFAPQQTPPTACTLSGTVINSVTGAPLTKVELQAEPLDGSLADSTTTDAKGNFTMVDLPAGQYRLKGVRNGFLETYYGAHRAHSKGTTITLEAGQELKDLQIKLLPFGLIAGTVRDTDGEPILGAEITLLQQSYDETGNRTTRRAVEGIKTDDLGQYRIADLEPGKYYIQAEPRSLNQYGFLTPIDHSVKSAEPPTALLPTLYPGVVDPTAAQAVEVDSGAHVSVDITLVRSRVYRVAGTATAAAGLEVHNLWLESPGFENVGLEFAAETKNGNGDFEFRGIPQGTYTLKARGDPRQYLARIPVSVNRDLEGVQMRVGAGTDIVAHITVEGGDNTRLAGSPVHFSNRNGGVNPPIVTADNSFGTSLYPDHYIVSLDLDKSKLIIKSIRSDGIDVFQDGLSVSEGGKVALEIVLAPEGGQVDGVVVDKDEKPAAGATVVLIADGKLRARADSYHAYTTDQYGRYHFENIRPGDYKLFVWDDPEPNAWFDPEFLRSSEDKAERVTIPIKGHEVKRLHL